MTSPGEFELSIVVPAYNEQARIAQTLIRTLDYVKARHPHTELLVVDDGSSDETVRIVEEIARSAPELRVLRQPRNLGKGAAVRRGMLEARGRRVLFMDADLATPIEELDKLLIYARQGADVVIGSRGLADSDIRHRQPAAREFMGRIFNLVVRSLVMGGIRDTQCGFKLFSRDAAQAIFSKQRLDGFAFDVETLMLAKEQGFSVKEVPVVWYHAPNSKVSPLVDANRMFWDVVTMRMRMRARERSERAPEPK